MFRVVSSTLCLAALIMAVLSACGGDTPGTATTVEPNLAASVEETSDAQVADISASGGVSGTALAEDAHSTCDATPRQTEGPFYFDAGQVRRDITEGKQGQPLLVSLQVVEADSCAPVPDTAVDIWHTDAAGQYSGYDGQGDDGIDTSGETFLRGMQITDDNGLVEFETIYPGWYPGRTTHIHFKVYTDEGSLVASQLYFPDDITDSVYLTEPYSARGTGRTTNQNDRLLMDDPAHQALLGHVERNEDGFVVSLTIGIKR